MDFNGNWIMTEVPDDFFEVMKILGYNSLQRKYLKNAKILIHSTIKDNILTIKIDNKLYKKEKTYNLNGQPVEYIDEWKNPVLEISKWLDDITVEIKTIYLEKNITVIDVRHLNSATECLHEVCLMNPLIEQTIEVKMI